MCCMGTSHNALDDLIKIGEEESPYCSEHNVDVGLEFVSRGTHQLAEAHDADALQTVRIYHDGGMIRDARARLASRLDAAAATSR